MSITGPAASAGPVRLARAWPCLPAAAGPWSRRRWPAALTLAMASGLVGPLQLLGVHGIHRAARSSSSKVSLT